LPSVVDAVAVHHDTELLIVHFVLLETVTSDAPPFAVNNSSEDEMESCGAIIASFFLQNVKNVMTIKNAKNLYRVLVFILFHSEIVFKKNLQAIQLC